MTVYVVQEQTKYDKEQGKFVPRFDLSSAKEYGEIVFLLSPTAKPFDSKPIKRELHEKLKYFSANDYILFIGNPLFIVMAGAIAAEYNEGNLKSLQWHGKDQKYIPLEVNDLFNEINRMA